MKRIYACIAIVAVLLSVAFYSSWKVQSFADVISADLDTAAEAIRNTDYPAAAHRYRWKHWNGSRTGWYKQKHRPCPIGRKPVF